MLATAPRRPALAPALLFVWTFWNASNGFPLAATLASGALAVFVLARSWETFRRIDAALLILACSAGMWVAWQAQEGPLDVLADAARTLPIGAPFERSWTGTMEASPKPIDGFNWLVPVVAGRLRLALEVPLRGDDDRVRLRALRAGDRIRFWARIRLDPETSRARALRGTIKSARLIEPLDASNSSPRYALQRYRDRLHRRLVELYGSDEQLPGFLAAVLLGDRSARDPRREARLRACGLAHLIAISGLHVGIVAALLAGLARRSLHAPWWRAIGIGGSLILFGILVGGATPVQRAVGAATGLLLARALGREGDPLNRLACLAVGLGLLSPAATGTTAYALSFAATAGILVGLSSPGGHGSRRTPLAQPLRISCSAYLATVPLSALLFGQLAPWAPLANLLALPCLVIVLTAGYASLVLAGVPYLGAAAIGLTRGGCAGIDRIAETIDRWVLSPLYVVEPHPAVCVLVIGAGLVGWLAPKRPLRVAARTLFALAVVWIHLGPPPDDFKRPGAVLLDVGQGQALFWHERGVTTLVDAGGRGYGRWDPGARIVRPALLARGVRRLDRLIVSHGHADHAAGAFATIDAFEIGELWLGPGWWHNPRLADLAARARRRGAAIRLVSRGDSTPGIRVHAPARTARPLEGNAGSLVVTLGTDPWSLFVPGDLDGAALDRFLAETSIPSVGAVVLAHHGSRRGTPDRLLARLRPRLALVSCGWRNRFRHPHQKTVERLKDRNIQLWRTDYHGTIRLSAEVTGWKVASER